MKRYYFAIMNLQVLYEDNHLLAVNKPAGMLVQGDKTGDACLLDYAKEYLKHKYHKPGNVFVGLVHRVDRPVSGVVLLTRTSKALARMNTLFKQRTVEKCYWALISGSLPQESGQLVHWLRKNRKKNKATVASSGAEDTKEALLNYQLLSVIGKKRLVALYPLTGRPHQLRVQLSAVGCPILGDVKYGSPKLLPDGDICLHARSLTFVHPIKKEALTIEASLPLTGDWKSFSDFIK